MRVARLHGPGDIRIGDEPRPEPAPGEILVRVTAVGLCGSDRHWYTEASIGESSFASALVLGHEICGIVEGGPRDGERVVFDPAIPCGRCDVCLAGRGNICPDVVFAGFGTTDGGLRQWMTWPAEQCLAIPGSISDAEAPLLEVLGVALHAIRLGEPRAGQRVGVYGAGPIGLVLVAALRSIGVTDIVATDRLAHRVAAATAAGASDAVLVADGVDPAAGIPVDVAFETAGEDAAIDTAVRAIRPGGRVVLLGIPSAARSSFPAAIARRKELEFRMCRRMDAVDLDRAIEVAASGAVRLAPFVSHTFDLDHAVAAFEMLADRRGLKVIVAP